MTSASSKLRLIAVTSSTAVAKACSFACEGFVEPLILRTNCIAAARTSSSVAGGSKLNRVLMFLHTMDSLFPDIERHTDCPGRRELEAELAVKRGGAFVSEEAYV